MSVLNRPPLAARLLGHAVVYLAAASMLAPFLWMVATALMTDAEALDPRSLVPRSWQWANFVLAWEAANLGRYYFNSFAAALALTVFGVLHCALAGFAFAKMRFRGRQGLFIAALATMMLPLQVYFIFAYIIVDRLGYIDTLQALYVPFLATGFGIFYMRQAISTVPDSLLEAGRMDGMTDFELFWNIVGPTAWPGISALGIFTFVFSWNNFFWPLVVVDSDAATTLPLAVSHLAAGRYVPSWPVIMAAMTILTVPLIVVFLIFQRAFVQGVALTGIKE
jgi:multiple sugar transport system permease protein